jgi:hypothetical protein
MDTFNYCRVCGAPSDELPWGEDGNTPSFNICNCCGVEFGYEDCNLSSIRIYRNQWVSKGYPWYHKKLKPYKWDLLKAVQQLNNIPKDFL